MRAIKFRARKCNEKSKKWYYGDVSYESDGTVSIWERTSSNGYTVTPESVGQYTGVNDVSGAEIYEGDILRECEDELPPMEVVFSDGTFCAAYDDSNYMPLCMADKSGDGRLIKFFVAGNILDNPHIGNRASSKDKNPTKNPTEEKTMTESIKTPYRFVLCEARHKHPDIDGLPAIFGSDVNPMNYDSMRRRADEALKDVPYYGVVDIYVTGLTPALVEVMNVAILYQLRLRLFNFDRESNSYVVQTTETGYYFPYLRDDGRI